MEQLFDTTNNRGDAPMDRARLAEAMADCDVFVPTVTDNAIDEALIERRRRAAAADRQFRRGREPYRPEGGTGARHRRHQHAGRADRGHRRHHHGADPLGAAPARRGREAGARRPLERLVAQRNARASHRRQDAAASSAWVVSAARSRNARQAFGLSIHYHNRHRLPDVGRGRVSARPGTTTLDGMLEAIDILTIHTPRNADSENMIDARRLGLMRPTACIVNTAARRHRRRGGADRRAGKWAAGRCGPRRLEVRARDRPAHAGAAQCHADPAHGLRHL